MMQFDAFTDIVRCTYGRYQILGGEVCGLGLGHKSEVAERGLFALVARPIFRLRPEGGSLRQPPPSNDYLIYITSASPYIRLRLHVRERLSSGLGTVLSKFFGPVSIDGQADIVACARHCLERKAIATPSLRGGWFIAYKSHYCAISSTSPKFF